MAGLQVNPPDALGAPLLDALLSGVTDGVYCTDPDGRITLWNRAAEEISGYSAQEVLDHRCCDGILVHVGEDGESLCHTHGCPIQRALTRGAAPPQDAWLLHKDGHRVPVRVRALPLTGEDGRVRGMVEIFSDLSHREASRERIAQLEQLALLDPVTRIGNRRYGELQLETRLRDLQRSGWSFGILFADIDRFKLVNDRHGHEAGDKVLRMVARTFANTLRANDTVCRWGGEELVAILVDVRPEQLHPVAEKVRAMVERSAIVHQGARVKVTLSIGATIARPEDSMETLVQRADELMYRCKQSGRNCVSSAAPGP